MQCLVCQSPRTAFHARNDGIDYHECHECESLFVDREMLARDGRSQRVYDEDYWAMEIPAARERSFGSTMNRLAEAIALAREPIRSIVDIGSGPGFFLDAAAMLMPGLEPIPYAVEPFPPPPHWRTAKPHLVIGTIEALPLRISLGLCIEVIEHLFPADLDALVRALASQCEPGALLYFNSGQPRYVKHEDPGYLDPFRRGHVVSYGIKALTTLFGRHGFSVSRLPGRHWAFIAELTPQVRAPQNADELMMRLWTPHPDNVRLLATEPFGQMVRSIGIESSRCYLEAAKNDPANA